MMNINDKINEILKKQSIKKMVDSEAQTDEVPRIRISNNSTNSYLNVKNNSSSKSISIHKSEKAKQVEI